VEVRGRDALAPVAERAAQTLEWASPQLGLLNIALDHLTLARVALYAALLNDDTAQRATAAPISDTHESKGNPRMRFEWDENKNRANMRKHGIDFREAVYVFSDPHALSVPDDDHSDDEER
jgi:hypothetical protein